MLIDFAVFNTSTSNVCVIVSVITCPSDKVYFALYVTVSVCVPFWFGLYPVIISSTRLTFVAAPVFQLSLILPPVRFKLSPYLYSALFGSVSVDEVI